MSKEVQGHSTNIPWDVHCASDIKEVPSISSWDSQSGDGFNVKERRGGRCWSGTKLLKIDLVYALMMRSLC